jgi:hypothetical protein
MSDKSVLLVTIKFKKRILMTNEFAVRLSSTEFGDQFTIEKLIQEGYKKHRMTALTGRNFLVRTAQRLLGYGKYIGFNSSEVLTVYTEKDKGRIALADIARHVLVNNEVIVVEYYDRSLLLTTGVLMAASLAYFGFNLRKYIHYRIHRSTQLSIKTF